MKAGFHDELGAAPYVVIKAADGHEQYARLGVGKALPPMGKAVTLSLDARGVAQIGAPGRGSGTAVKLVGGKERIAVARLTMPNDSEPAAPIWKSKK